MPAIRPAIRVLVLGNSMATLVHARSSRREGPYAEVLQELLRNEGVDAEVRNAGGEFETIDRGERKYREDERGWSPDVVVIQYGMIDAQPPFLPARVYDHFTRWDTGMSRPAMFYRSKVAVRLWPWVRRYQRRMARLTDKHFWRTSPRKFTEHLKRLTFAARYEHRLTLVLDVTPPGSRVVHGIPGIAARVERYQKIVADTVAEANDPDLRLIPGSALADEFGVDNVVPDGYHWTPSAHRRIAEMLLAEIVPWAKMNLWESGAD